MDYKFIFDPKRNNFKGVFYFKSKDHARRTLLMTFKVDKDTRDLKAEIKSLEFDMFETIKRYIPKMRLPVMKSPFISCPPPLEKTIPSREQIKPEFGNGGLHIIQESRKRGE